MPDSTTLLAITIAALAMNAIPGPSTLYVMAVTFSRGRKAALGAVLGLFLGSYFYVLILVAGISLIEAITLRWIVQIKIFGVLYLMYFGISEIRNSAKISGNGRAEGSQSLILKSFLVEISNPKTILFYIAFVPMFVDPHKGDISMQIVILASITALTTIPCDLFAVVFSSTLKKYLDANTHSQKYFNYASGATLILLSIMGLTGLLFEYT